MMHLWVTERQGPIIFSRSACGNMQKDRDKMELTIEVARVTCPRCRRTRVFKSASKPRRR